MVSKRAKDNLSTKEKILEEAQKLMLTKGFNATTVEEICEAAGVTKGSFFYYFESKEDLGKKVTEYYWQKMSGLIGNAPFRKYSDPLRRIYGFIDYFIEISQNPAIEQSCLLGNFAQEVSDTHPAIRKICADCFSQWANELRKDLDAANEKYPSRKSPGIEGLAEYIISVMEGSLLLAKAHQNLSITTRNLQHLRQHMEDIFEGKNGVRKQNSS